MAGIDLVVSVAGEDVLVRKMATMQKGLGDLGGVWDDVADWFYKMEAAQFASEGHGDWKPLAESTVRKRGSAHPILEETGKLIASLLGGSGHIRSQTPDSLTLGTSVKVGTWSLGMLHQTGTYKMPARPVIGRDTQSGKLVLYSSDVTSLRAIMQDYIHKIATA